MVKMDYDNGIKGLKHLAKVLIVNNQLDDFEKYTGAFLDRQGFHSWWSR